MTDPSWMVSDHDFLTLETGSNFNEADAIKDLAEGYDGYGGLDFHWYVQQVADRIFNIHQDRDVNPLLFTMTCNADGEIDGGEVALYVPDSWSVHLMRALEFKQLTDDREAKGEEGLLAIKSCLLTCYEGLRTWGFDRGLL